MNLQQIHDAVVAKGYSFTTTAGDPTDPILLQINAIYREISGAQRWPWLSKTVTSLSTTSGTATVSLASITDLNLIDAVRLTDTSGNNYNLRNLDPLEFKRQFFESVGTSQLQLGTPQAWTQDGTVLRFWPVPDAVYTITLDYFFLPPDLASVSDVPAIPTAYHDVLVWGAVRELAYRERDIWGQEFAGQYYQERYKAMQAEYMLRQRQTSSRVKVSGFYTDHGWW